MVGLLIVSFVCGRFIEQVFIDFHRAHDSLNERDLACGKAIPLIEVTVGPRPVPLLGRNEGLNFASSFLGWLVQENQETRQSTAEVRQDTLSLAL